MIFCLLFCFKTDKNEKIISLFGLVGIALFKVVFLANFKTELSSFQFESTFTNMKISNLIEDINIILYYIFIYISQVPLFIVSFIALVLALFINKLSTNIKKFVILYGILNILFIFVAFLFTMEDVDWQSKVGMKRVLFESSGFYLITVSYLFKKNKKYL
tara:strand:- start:11171 stop:11650 length:480 start_codon:yes stop_codon:yes gene_type:complete